MAQEIKKAILKSSDDEIFEVDLAVAFESEALKQLIEDTGSESVLPLPNVSGKIVAKVIEFCKYQVEADKIVDEMSDISKKDEENWEQDFMKVDLETLFDLILAASFLNIKSLLELTCQTVADMMKGKTPEDIREIFNIQNDYTPEEEAEVRRENQWAFE